MLYLPFGGVVVKSYSPNNAARRDSFPAGKPSPDWPTIAEVTLTSHGTAHHWRLLIVRYLAWPDSQ
jgi:hypothetical protein